MSINIAFTQFGRQFSELKERTLRDDLIFYFGIVIAILSASFLMMLHEGNSLGIIGVYIIPFLIILFVGLMNGVILLLGVSLIEHFFLLFVDVTRGFETTMKSAIYPLALGIPLFWAATMIQNPYLGYVVLITFVLFTIASIRVFHEISIDRAVFISLATGALLMIFFFRWLFIPV